MRPATDTLLKTVRESPGRFTFHAPSYRNIDLGNCQMPRVQLCPWIFLLFRAIPHNSKWRYGERGATDAKPKAQIILDAAKVSAASGGYSEPKQGQRSQSARGFCPRSTMRVSQPDIIEHFGNADAVPQPPDWCLSRQVGIVRYCLSSTDKYTPPQVRREPRIALAAAVRCGRRIGADRGCRSR